jgi:hypothetical protein
MTSINYKEIYSLFYTKASAYDFLDLYDAEIYNFLCNWLHSSCSKPYVRRLFSKLSFDDEILNLSFELKYSVDEDYDKEFVMDLLSSGILLCWLEPKINSIENILQVYGSSEEKFYSQSSHLKELKDLKDGLKKEQRQMIADRAGAWNTYLDGES